MTTENNPFMAPQAGAAEVKREASGSFIPEGRNVPAGNGVNWLGSGWEMFKKAPGPWIGLTVVYIIMLVVLGMIPLVNLAINFLAPVFMGGIMLGCKALDDGEEISINHLFAGFSAHFGNLALVGLIYLGGFVAIFVVVGLIAAVGLGAGAAMGSSSVALVPMVLGGLLGVLLIVPLAMAVWFAPALVVFHAVPPFQAMKASFFVSIKNFMPFLLYGLVFIVLAIVATIPLGLGWLILIPVTMASMYAGYRDMFIQD